MVTLSLDLHLSSLILDSLFLVDSSGAWDLTHSALLTNPFPYSLHSPAFFTAVSLLLPTLFSSLFSSLPDPLQLSTPHHISTVLTSLLSSHLYSLHISNLLICLLSSHLYSLHTSPRHTMRFQTSKPHLTKPWKQPSQCKMQAWITKHNGKAHAIFQRSPPGSADNGNRSSAARTQTAPVAHTRFPPSTPGATLCKNAQGCRAISNIQASPGDSCSTTICNQRHANHTTAASTTLSTLQLHIWTLPHLYPLRSPSPIFAHPYSLHF